MIRTRTSTYSSDNSVAVSYGFSDTASILKQLDEEFRDRLREAFSLGFQPREIYDELYVIAQECGIEAWDGEQAVPISKAAYDQAVLFAKSLPIGIAVPAVGVEPDGHITFEWYISPSRVMSVSVAPQGVLYYAALMGPSKAYGSERLLLVFLILLSI